MCARRVVSGSRGCDHHFILDKSNYDNVSVRLFGPRLRVHVARLSRNGREPELARASRHQTCSGRREFNHQLERARHLSLHTTTPKHCPTPILSGLHHRYARTYYSERTSAMLRSGVLSRRLSLWRPQHVEACFLLIAQGGVETGERRTHRLHSLCHSIETLPDGVKSI
jgi:hypothetical protein